MAQLSAVQFIGTHHIAITTPHFKQLRAFYVEMLGLPVVGGFPGHDIVFIEAGGTTIELVGEDVAAAEPRCGGWNHLAWVVADVDAAYAALSALGIPFTVPPEDFPPEAPTLRIAFFQDPDGNLIELVQRIGGSPAPTRRGTWGSR